MRDISRVLIVTPPEEVDAETVVDFMGMLQEALEGFPAVLVVDMGAVSFMGSAGVEALRYAKDVLDQSGGRLVVRHASWPLRKLLGLMPDLKPTVEAGPPKA
jgi:anti-anti-sigma factor